MSNGGLQNIFRPGGSGYGNFYTDLNGNIRSSKTIYTIDSEFNLITSEIQLPDGVSIGGRYLFYFSKNVFVMSEGGYSEIEGDNPRYVSLPIRNIKNAEKSDSFIYVSGYNDSYQPALLKVDPFIDDYQYIFEPNLYDVYSFSVSDDDVITFTALRMNDGAKVIGSVLSTNEITILSTEFNTESIILERID